MGVRVTPRLLLPLTLACVGLACLRTSPTGVSVDRAVQEPSGLTASPTHPGVLWTHGDSGTGNWLFAIDAKGKLLARLRVKGAENVDWEDITHDEAGNLWLGDIGNNDSGRRDLAIYRIQEPDPNTGDEELTVAGSVAYSFAEQTSFGDKFADFDAEALFWWRETLWLLTKHRSNDMTRLYRFPALSGEVVLEQVASFDLGAHLDPEKERKKWTGQVTAAEVAPDGLHWAMLTYEAVFVFAIPASGEGASLFDELVTRIAFDQDDTRQTEALAWDQDALLVVNEDRAVFRIEKPLTRTEYRP